MIQILINYNYEGMISDISFRLSKNIKIKNLINEFIEKHEIDLIDIQGWFYKLSFSNIINNLKIIEAFTIELYKIFIDNQIIDDINPYDLILTLPSNKYTEKVIDFLSNIPSFNITVAESFSNVRNVDSELMFSLFLSLTEEYTELWKEGTRKRSKENKENDQYFEFEVLPQALNQNCLNLKNSENTLSCMNINRIKKKEEEKNDSNS